MTHILLTLMLMTAGHAAPSQKLKVPAVPPPKEVKPTQEQIRQSGPVGAWRTKRRPYKAPKP